MNRSKTKHYAAVLRQMATRMQGTADTLEEEARSATGGETQGGLSNVPLHLGDLASGVYTQELSATLLENEDYLLEQIGAALQRIESGAYGKCEACQAAIGAARLDVVPYARYCVDCAERLRSGKSVSINTGRSVPAARASGLVDRIERPAAAGGNMLSRTGDPHAAGTPGGGTSVGGLAGSTIGDGDPDDANLEDALGSGDFDRQEAVEEKDEADLYPARVKQRPAAKKRTLEQE